VARRSASIRSSSALSSIIRIETIYKADIKKLLEEPSSALSSIIRIETEVFFSSIPCV